ncbi:LysR family transcriptional regulator [Paraburkholderia sp. EG286A]|uniref:LysR family transcriptional regulator n=2 Tax=Paraburkholderia TaxID=1822464 RepID=UPI0034D23AFE
MRRRSARRYDVGWKRCILHFSQMNMHSMHAALRRLDLNLLLVFDALYRHRSVAAAADELALSASACSHALSRLRGTLGDDLFVRYGSAMQPTALADQISQAVADALRLLSDNLGSAGPFVPATSTQTFTLAATDFTAFALLPGLMARLQALAPDLRVNVVYSSHRDSLEDLAAGRAHFALSFADADSTSCEGVESLDCFTDEYVVAARKPHPRVSDSLSIEQYLHEKHVAVLPWTSSGSVIDAALMKSGYRRRVAVQLPSLMAAPFIVANTELLLTLPRRAAEQLSKATPLAIFPTPFESPGYTLRVYFHIRHAGIAAHAWMREQLIRALDEGHDLKPPSKRGKQ